MTTEGNLSTDTPATPDELLRFWQADKLYEDGKHRRYELLFAVNGGAFAVAKLIGSKDALGGLTLGELAVGMILFSAAMIVDIFKFGLNWNAIGQEICPGDKYTIFGIPGRLVLIFMGILLFAGWAVAAHFWH